MKSGGWGVSSFFLGLVKERHTKARAKRATGGLGGWPPRKERMGRRFSPSVIYLSACYIYIYIYILFIY
jgi:hypothetical protein